MTSHRKNNDSTTTKHVCVFGLVMSWLVGMTALALGAVCLAYELRNGVAVHLQLENKEREIIPLLLNIVVTLLVDSMGYIHSCALRWVMHREGLLEFNSNLRLLRVSKYSPANGLVANGVCFVGILLSYGSTSLVFLTMKPELAAILGKAYVYQVGDHTGVHINYIALFTLGGGLISQALVTTWALGTTNITTWSSNPLDVVYAFIHDEHDGHRIEPRTGRCMMGVHLAKEDAKSLRPSPKQKPMITANFRVKRILALLLLTPIIAAAWAVGTLAYVRKYEVLGAYFWPLIPLFQEGTRRSCSGQYCGSSVLNIGWTTTNGAWGTFGGVVLVMIIQSIVTVSLQGAELLVNLSRDEEVYRKLIGPKGTNGHYNSIWASFTSWRTLVLFALKAGVHWMFGLSINLQCEIGVNMYPAQIVYLSFFTLFMAIFGLYLALHRPKGYLPATYGHIQTMADVIDEWSDSGCMFWGEKDPGDPQRGIPGYTGTSSHRLKAPDERQFYGGQREKFCGPLARHSASNLSISSVATRPSSSSNTATTLAPPGWIPLQLISNPGSREQGSRRSSSSRHFSMTSVHSGQSNHTERSNESMQPFLAESG
ncbi:hypothetical protein V8F20_008432 [Naviculisporaceae sp. PSN 640]